MSADEQVNIINYEVLKRVAEYAFSGELEEKAVDIPVEMIPGPTPQFRCCIYREREIIRQRVRLAMGMAPESHDNGNIVQVIRSACEDCPISTYTITENCQNCLGKACTSACKFGAIEVGKYRSHIDASKCKECGRCAAACPYNAIAYLKRPCKFACPVDAITYTEYGICKIDRKKCIRCGKCVHSCPFGAISYKSQIVDVIREIKGAGKIYAMIAPATEGQMGEGITLASWKKALREVGFDDAFEVGLGADLTAYYEAEEWIEAYRNQERKITSCCPAFVNMVYTQFPELADHLSTTVSPMCALSRMLKAKEPGAVTVFIGPCLAKKSEILDQKIPGNADYALVYGEAKALLRAKNIELVPCENEEQMSSKFGKRFASSGGVTAAVLKCMEEQHSGLEVNVCRANGAAECRKALTLMKFGRLSEDFVEGMVCDGGCVGGPSVHDDPVQFKKRREKLLCEADDRGIGENLERYDLTGLSMHRE